MFGKLKTPDWVQSKTLKLSLQEVEQMDDELCKKPGATVLKAMVQSKQPTRKCDCDLFSPGSYGWSSCLLALFGGHAEIHLDENLAQNTYGHFVYTPPLLLGHGYESIHLAHSFGQYMNRSREYSNDDQTAARINLKRWITGLNVLVLPQNGNGDELI
jgi:hypothetical protein